MTFSHSLSIPLIPLEIKVAEEPDAIWEGTVRDGGRSPALSNKREPGTLARAAGAGTPALDGAGVGTMESRPGVGGESDSVELGDAIRAQLNAIPIPYVSACGACGIAK